MVRRVSISQYNSMVRQAQAKQREAIRKYNNAATQHNREVKRAIENFNREARAHNARVHANRQRVRSAISRLESEARKPSRVTYTVRSTTVYSAYERLEQRAEEGFYGDQFNEALDMAEREAANSIELESALNVEPTDLDEEPDLVPDPTLLNNLAELQSDLADRWRGALFALSPKNPDAARHFCTSAREIFSKIFDLAAPDAATRASFPSDELTSHGSVTRRTKIKFMLSRDGLADEALESFVQDDIDNILTLFQVFNDGTHGSAGKFGASQLRLIKQRVENGLQFLMKFAAA
ncbi:MAG: hypothetical protein V4696_04220 [Pseudomonadota bacterium]